MFSSVLLSTIEYEAVSPFSLLNWVEGLNCFFDLCLWQSAPAEDYHDVRQLSTILWLCKRFQTTTFDLKESVYVRFFSR